MSQDGTTNMHNENEGNPNHEINTALTSMLGSATMIPQVETEQIVPDLNIVDHHDVGSSIPPLRMSSSIPPMFRNNASEKNNKLLLSVAMNVANGNFELILTSTALELRRDRRRLRHKIFQAQEELDNSTVPGTAKDLMMTEYSMALNMLDAQERLDRMDEDAWRYEAEGGLKEEEIMTHITHEVFQSYTEDEENEKCAICEDDFADGEDIGRVDCEHKFHLKCIKEWLLQKNTCPICNQTALSFVLDQKEDESDG